MKNFISTLTIAAIAFGSVASAQDPLEQEPDTRDENRDGLISLEENTAFHRAIFEAYDANGDEFLSFDEFYAPKLAKFDSIDADEDDVLSRDERVDALLERKLTRLEWAIDRREGGDE